MPYPDRPRVVGPLVPFPGGFRVGRPQCPSLAVSGSLAPFPGRFRVGRPQCPSLAVSGSLAPFPGCFRVVGPLVPFPDRFRVCCYPYACPLLGLFPSRPIAKKNCYSFQVRGFIRISLCSHGHLVFHSGQQPVGQGPVLLRVIQPVQQCLWDFPGW